MKTTNQHIKIFFSSVLFLLFFISNAQTMYEDQLETVYLNQQDEEVVYTNDFSYYNDHLIRTGITSFRVIIKNAKDNNDQLLFLSERSNLQILKALYLKTIRKAANKSADSQTFKQVLQTQLPELMHQLEKDSNIEELYFLTRKNTFNGKIDALPSVL